MTAAGGMALCKVFIYDEENGMAEIRGFSAGIVMES